jgi:uracil phosphoribosyltransferase
MLRNKETNTKQFRELVGELAMLMCYEVTRNLPLVDAEIETPICKSTFKVLANEKIAIVPILRAGLGMADGILRLVPSAKIGHIGLNRDEVTHDPHTYFCKLPKGIEKRLVILPDPMLATGGSAIQAVDFIKAKGCKNIKFMCIIAAPEGLQALQNAHPDIDIYVGSLDECLNDNAYIVPGLGDAGDRIFGTD